MRLTDGRPNDGELHQKVWPDGTFVDFQDALSHDVNRIREALSDIVENPHYIETIPRKGYRFIHAIEPIEPETATVTVPLAGENPPLEGVKKGVDRESSALMRHGKTLGAN